MERTGLILLATALVVTAAVDRSCPPNSQCPDSMTCCPSGQSFSCCPFSDADCCPDGEHCCPSGYKCDMKQQACVPKRRLAIPVEMNRQFACAKAPGIRGDARENTTESKERSLQERSKPAKGREGSSSSSSESQPPSVQTAVEHPDQFGAFYGRPRWRRYASCVLVTTALSILICLVPLLSIRLYIECQQPTCQNCIEETSNSIDDSEKPCDNLYEYVCGKYASALNTWFPNAFLRVQVPIFLSFYKKIMLEDAEAVREEQGEDRVSHKAVLMTQRCLFEAYDFGGLASCPSCDDYKHTRSTDGSAGPLDGSQHSSGKRRTE